MPNTSYYNKQIGRSLCSANANKVDANYISDGVSYYNTQIGTPLYNVNSANKNNTINYKPNISYYNKQLRGSMCGMISKNKISIININSNNVRDSSMQCDDTFHCLETTIDYSTGKVKEVVCRKEMGCIDTGMYIITVKKKNMG